MNRHPTHDELLDRLYGVGRGEIEPHLRQCGWCAARYRALERAWDRVTSEAASGPELSSEFLAAQRRAVYARLEDRPGGQVPWAPALAAALLLAVGLFLYQPLSHGSRGAPPPAYAEISDEQLFSDVYFMEQSAEPLAAAPIHGLFETAALEPTAESER